MPRIASDDLTGDEVVPNMEKRVCANLNNTKGFIASDRFVASSYLLFLAKVDYQI